MASKKVTIGPNGVQGLSPDEMKILADFIQHNQKAVDAVSEISKEMGTEEGAKKTFEKVHNSLIKDLSLISEMVARKELSLEEAGYIVNEYEQLSENLRIMQEGFMDDAKELGKKAYAGAGLAFDKAKGMAIKGLGNIVGFMKKHPKLTLAIGILSAMVLVGGGEHASASTMIHGVINGQSMDFSLTKGEDLQTLLDMVQQASASGDKDGIKTIAFALHKMGKATLLLGDGTSISGTGNDIVKALTKASGHLDKALLFSANEVPLTGAASMSKDAVNAVGSTVDFNNFASLK
jgi:uncharacterized protein YfkK (UPF0435 family)